MLLSFTESTHSRLFSSTCLLLTNMNAFLFLLGFFEQREPRDEPIIIDPEIPDLVSPESRSLASSLFKEELQFDAVKKCAIHLPPDDCMVLMLQYLDSARDLDNFRRTSKHFCDIHDQFIRYKSEALHAINQILKKSHSIPCISNVHLDLNNIHSINSLSRMQYRFNREVVSGLLSRQNDPFLSLSLVNDDRTSNSILLICVFDFDGLANVMMIKSCHTEKNTYGYTVADDDDGITDFALKDLVKVLNSKRLKMDEVTWRLGSKGCAEKMRGKCHALRGYRDDLCYIICFCSPKVACVTLLIICWLFGYLVCRLLQH